MSDENIRVAVLRVRLNREKAVSQHAGKERRRAETRIGSKPATEKRDDRQHSDGEKRNSTRERTRAMYVGGNSRQCRMEEKERRRERGRGACIPRCRSVCCRNAPSSWPQAIPGSSSPTRPGHLRSLPSAPWPLIEQQQFYVTKNKYGKIAFTASSSLTPTLQTVYLHRQAHQAQPRCLQQPCIRQPSNVRLQARTSKISSFFSQTCYTASFELFRREAVDEVCAAVVSRRGVAWTLATGSASWHGPSQTSDWTRHQQLAPFI